MTSSLVFCCGDVHLGRRPSRLPSALAEQGLTADRLSPVAAWNRLVELACTQRPAALLLAGDVVDSETARYEAFGPLQRGVERLTSAGVKVVAVAGNHDVEALPKLARMIPGFHLLGEGGVWETTTLDDGVELLGWSFADRLGADDPLAGLHVEPPAPGHVRLGLLHTEVGGSDPRYAPVSRSALAAAPVGAWLLGHLHAPSLDGAEARPIGYLGSLVGLDPSETGSRGAWELRIRPEGGVRLGRLPIAPLRWEAWKLDADAVGDRPDELFAALQRGIERHHRRIEPELGEALAVGCRVRISGRSRLGPELRRAAAEIEQAAPVLPCGRVSYFVDRLSVAVRPALDLERLAQGSDPLALLARELLALERGDADPALIEAAREEILRSWAPTRHPSVDLPDEPADDEVLERLRDAALEALEELIAQREGAS